MCLLACMHDKYTSNPNRAMYTINYNAENVAEYLKLSTNANKEQLRRIKETFENRNRKSTQVISQLQDKLDSYTRKLHELDMNAAPVETVRKTPTPPPAPSSPVADTNTVSKKE